MADELVNIGTFALQTGLSIPMLRYYHEIGVLEPAFVDPDTGYRRYSRNQVDRARLISRLRSVEVPVAELTQALAAEAPGLQVILQAHRDRLSARLEDTQRMLAFVNELLKEEIPMETQGSFLCEVTLRVRDLDAAVDFYRRVFGFEFQPDDHNGAAPLHYDACGGSWQPQGTNLFTLWPAGDRPETTGMQIGFGVPNVDVLLKSVTGCEPAVVDELLRSGLLAEDGERLRFRHEIARLAVEQEIAAHRRGRIHSQILAGLRALGCDDDAQMAFHAEGAADDQSVLQLAPQAARRAAELGSHREAAAQLERAVRFAASADPAKAAELYEALSDELTQLDRADGAIAAGQRSVALWQASGNKLREGEILRKLACALEHGGRGAESLSAGEAAVASLEPLGPTIELAAAYAGLACRRMVHNRHEEAIECADRALAIAEPLGAIDVMSDALNFQACSVYCQGGEWARIMRRALDIAVDVGYHNQAGRAFANFYSILVAQRRFAEADQLFSDGIAYCDEHEMATHATSMSSDRATALERTGRWPEAVELSLKLIADQKASTLSRIVPHTVIGIVRARRAESGAWSHLDDSSQQLTRLPCRN